MTLSSRLTLSTMLMIAALAAVAMAGVWGVNSLNRDLTAAQAEYERVRRSYEVGIHVWRARDALRNSPPNTLAALSQVLAGRSEVADVRADAVFGKWYADLAKIAGGLSKEPTDPQQIKALTERLTVLVSATGAHATDSRDRIDAIQRQASLHRSWVVTMLLLASSVAMVLSVAVGLRLYRAVMRPVRATAAGARAVAGGAFDHRLTEAGDAELAALAADFNRMAQQLETLYTDLESQVRQQSAQLARSERLASVGHLAAGVAHEINNPLGIIAAHAELALRDAAGDEAARGMLETIRDEAFRCKGITDRLLSLSRGYTRREVVELDKLAESVARQVQTLPASVGRDVSVHVEPVSVAVDPDLVRQVVLNLLVNATEATAAGGTIRVVVEAGEDSGRVVVTDDGVGMDEAAMSRVFEPFFTTRRGGEKPGTGLGLSISHAIAEQLGGSLTAASDGPGHGSTFTLVLPVGDAPGG